jgi:hypothetical protein
VARIGDFLRLPLYAALLSSLLVPVLPFLILLLRWRETHDPVLAPIPLVARNKLLSSIEDRDVTNQRSVIGSLKPRRFRRWLTVAILWTIDWSGRHLVTTGRLGRVNIIHLASWTLTTSGGCSSPAITTVTVRATTTTLSTRLPSGSTFPSPTASATRKITDWMTFDGARHEQDFKRYLFHY